MNSNNFILLIVEISMEPGHVGEDLRIVNQIEFEDGIAALHVMNNFIEKGLDFNARIVLADRDGDRLPFNLAFTQIVGEQPRYTAGGTLINAPWKRSAT